MNTCITMNPFTFGLLMRENKKETSETQSISRLHFEGPWTPRYFQVKAGPVTPAFAENIPWWTKQKGIMQECISLIVFAWVVPHNYVASRSYDLRKWCWRNFIRVQWFIINVQAGNTRKRNNKTIQWKLSAERNDFSRQDFVYFEILIS